MQNIFSKAVFFTTTKNAFCRHFIQMISAVIVGGVWVTRITTLNVVNVRGALSSTQCHTKCRRFTFRLLDKARIRYKCCGVGYRWGLMRILWLIIIKFNFHIWDTKALLSMTLMPFTFHDVHLCMWDKKV